MSTNANSPRPPRDQPNVPGYTALRVAADWASAVRGAPLYLEYDYTSGWLKAGSEHDNDIVLTTQAYASRPELLDVEFEVEDVERGRKACLVVSAQEASALFWGEAAVEKFLAPYYASAASADAPGFLGRLYDAWYGYPAHVVQVCAVAYRYGTRAPEPGTRLTLGATVGLVCLERETGRMRMLSLDEFTAHYAGRASQIHAPEPTRPHTEKMAGWRLTAVETENIVARDMAEFVSGLRGRTITFSHTGDRLTPALLPTNLAPDADKGPPPHGFLAAGMEHVRTDRPAPTRVSARVQHDGIVYAQPLVAPGSNPDNAPDSMFWSDGAVEKLMIPYYASVKGSTSPFFEGLLMAQWDGLLPPGQSQPDAVWTAIQGRLEGILDAYAPDRVLEPNTGERTSTVYTVTHLPRSEYATTEGTDSTEGLETRTVMHTLADGALAAYVLRGSTAATPPRTDPLS